MVADFVTTTSCTSPGSLPTRAQAELMVSFICSILSEIFAIAEESKIKNSIHHKLKTYSKYQSVRVFASIKAITVKILAFFFIYQANIR
jgi:hypothetical protein